MGLSRPRWSNGPTRAGCCGTFSRPRLEFDWRRSEQPIIFALRTPERSHPEIHPAQLTTERMASTRKAVRGPTRGGRDEWPRPRHWPQVMDSLAAPDLPNDILRDWQRLPNSMQIASKI